MVISGGVQYTLESPPKSSPDRRHKAQLRLDVDGDGDAWLQLTVTNRDGEFVHTSPPLTTYLSTKSFNAARRSLRWRDSETVSVDAQPDIGFGSRAGSLYVADLGRRSSPEPP